MSEGFIYVLSNPSMPGIVKIGKTTRLPTDRAAELYKQASGVPTPFRVEFAVWDADCDSAETQIHSDFDYFRVNKCREFFKVSIAFAIIKAFNVCVANYHEVEALASAHMPELSYLEFWADQNGESIESVLDAVCHMGDAEIAQAVKSRNERIARSGRRLVGGDAE